MFDIDKLIYAGPIVIWLVWNVITFAMMGIDKWKATHNRWRIPEATLLGAAFLMGGVGAMLGSKVFHHKTRKLKFRIGLPAALVVNVLIVVLLLAAVTGKPAIFAATSGSANAGESASASPVSSFSEATAASVVTSFSDVSEGAWYAKTVGDMTEAGWLSGYPDGTFRPDAKITGAEFVTIAARIGGLDKKSDTIGNHWASASVEAALGSSWFDWDELPPTAEQYDQPIKRQLAVKIMMNALLPDATGSYAEEAGKISDLSQLDGRYYDKVFAAYSAGVITGDPGGTFRAKDGLSRAEACILIQRAAEKAGSTPAGGGATQPENQTDPSKPDDKTDTTVPAAQAAIKGGVSQNGWLKVVGTQLCSESGKPVVLHGMSSHGIQWFPQYANAASIKATADYGANLFRIAMYTAEGGYISNPSDIKKKVIAAADAAIANDMYVIIDWHILADGNPQTYQTESVKFFSEMSARYKDCPAVMYEICNEPNGGASWDSNIKPYAETLVKTIRANSPQAVILIGSSTWSQDVDIAAQNPVKGTNLMYTLHFYAGTHGKDLRNKIDKALSKGLPIFVSEWGTSAADGNGGVYLDSAKVWLDYLDSKGISWANWSLCDKGESSAALKSGAAAGDGFASAELTESGKFVFGRF